MLRNTQDSYGSMAMILHWLIALLVIGMLIFGFYLSSFLPDKSPLKPELIGLHKSVGLTVLLLMILRLFWRFLNPQPLLPMTVPVWEKIAARSVQALFYITLLVMPVSGMLMSSYGGHTVMFWGWFNTAFPVAKNSQLASGFFTMHGVVAWIIIGLLVLHLGAAVKHHFIEKNNVLRRMLPGYHSPDLFRK
jgi:cytochrome b561